MNAMAMQGERIASGKIQGIVGERVLCMRERWTKDQMRTAFMDIQAGLCCVVYHYFQTHELGRIEFYRFDGQGHVFVFKKYLL